MDNYHDNELVGLLHINDVKAFDILYRKYHQPLYSNIFKLCKDAESTQDILQEVFISLWEKRFTLDADKPVANWLFAVSFNKTINFLKKTLKESTLLNSIDKGLQEDDEKKLNLKEIRLSLIEIAATQLSPQKMRIFNLCKIQGKSYEETAKELNISKYTVKEYLSAALMNIKEYVRQHPESSATFFYSALLPKLLFEI